MLELYHHGTSVCAAKVRFALMEKGLKWEGRYVDILAGDQFKPDYVKLNKKAVVPTLVDDGQVIVESTVICEYLDDRFPENPIRPPSAYGRAGLRIWTKIVDEQLHPVMGEITYVSALRHTLLRKDPKELTEFLDSRPPAGVSTHWHERRKTIVREGFSTPGIEHGFIVFNQYMQQLEDALAAGPWILGESFSLADIALAPYISRMELLGMSGLWVPHRPNIAGWLSRIKARPAFKTAISDWCPPPLLKDLSTFGSQSWPMVERILQTAN